MTTELEIVDTAIKVGLGALISGVTTYFVTMRAHAHEIRKTLQSEKKELLKEASIKLEQSGSLLNETRQMIHHLRIGEDKEKEAKFLEATKSFTVAYNLAKEARSLCHMIGQKPLADIITRYCNAIEELRVHYAMSGFAYDVAFVDSNTDKLAAMKNEILDHLAEAFDSIYT
jgi:hypothetical protein